METIVTGIAGFGFGLTRLFGAKERVFKMASKDKIMLTIACLVLIPCFTLIAFGKNSPECFGLIGLVVGHFFGRELGKSECNKPDK
jgi:hypothetical protein